MAPADDPMDLRERRRLLRRSELTGTITRLTPELRDALNPDNPFALAPTWPWRGWMAEHPQRWHDELRYFNQGLILPEGILLKGYSREGLTLLRETVERLLPLMTEEGIRIEAFYQTRGKVDLGGYATPLGHAGRELPQVITLSTAYPRWLLANGLHELAHDGDRERFGHDPRPRGMGDAAYQAQFHDERFRRRLGALLARYLEQHATYWERRSLTRWAATTDYAAPIHPEERSWSAALPVSDDGLDWRCAART